MAGDVHTESARRFDSGRARTDRVAVWALLLAALALIAGAASARAGGGGTGTGGGGGGGGGGACKSSQFGKRTLRMGDCGSDVQTLNWMLKSQRYRVPLKKDFNDPTDASVRTFQRHKGLHADGVVDDDVAGKLKRSLRKSPASWYGPGFFGNRTACGQTLHRDTVGVAHRNLPCGTKVVVGYQHHWVQTRVIDRGPYAKMQKYNVDWDLTQKTARKLGFEYNDKIRAGVIKR